MISISLVPNFKWRYLLPARPVPDLIYFENGRTALYFLLKALKITSGEVIIQAFTCSVVPLAIMEAGATPVYGDIDETYNLDPTKLRITKDTKAVIIQHTFGTPANYQKIRELCIKNHVYLIEDCAHYPKPFGDLAFYSFGRDKAIAAIFGGAIHNNDQLPMANDQLPKRDLGWNIKQYLYLFSTWFILKTYDFLSLGKALHFFLKKFNPPISHDEKRGKKHESYYRDFPLKNLVFNQFEDWDNMVAHRQKLAKIYADELGRSYNPDSTYLRYTIEVEDPTGLREFAAKHNIFLGDWYDQVIAPKSVDPTTFGYIWGSCPAAESAAKKVVNLPTNLNLTEQDALKVVKIVQQWTKKNGIKK